MADYGPRRHHHAPGGPTNVAYPYTTGHPAPYQQQQQPPRANAHGYPPTSVDHTYENLPNYHPKYPPSMDPSRSLAQVSVATDNLPGPGMSGPGLSGQGGSGSGQQVAVADIVSKLDFATKENLRLKEAIEFNSRFMEQKLKELQEQPHPLEKQVKDLKGKVTDATNRFFEARIAVMGFRCKVMQLQGELDKKQQTNPDDHRSLRAANAKLQKDLEEQSKRLSAAENDKERFRQEATYAQEQLRVKEADIQQLNVHLSQAHADKQNYHDHTLRGQIQELTMIRASLEGEVARLKESNHRLTDSNSSLLGKCKELQQQRDLMMEKLDKFNKAEGSLSPTSMPTPPTPKPRPGDKERLERDLQRLQEDLHRAEEERERLRAERDAAAREKTTINEMFQESNRKSQKLIEQNVSLSSENSQLKQDLEVQQYKVEELGAAEGAKVECERLRGEYETLHSESQSLRSEVDELRQELSLERREKEGMESQLRTSEKLKSASLEEVEKLKKSREEVREEARRFQRELREAEEKLDDTKPPQSMSGRGTSASTLRKLNDAVGKVRHLEAENRELKERAGDTVEEHERVTRQIKIKFEALEEDLRREKEVNSRAAMEDYSKLQRENSELRVQGQRQSHLVKNLELEQQQMVAETMKLRNQLDQSRQELVQYTTEKTRLSRQITTTEVEFNSLKGRVRELEDLLEEESKEKTKKKSKLESLQKSYSELQASKEQLKEEVSEKSTRIIHINNQLESVQQEKDDLRQMGEEFQKESEAILSDYNVCAQRLKMAQEEASRWSQQHQKVVTELDRQKERVGLLEEQRSQLEEKLSHMDQQIKIYHEDFDRERNAREAAVKVKNLAEDRMKKKDKEIKELRERLNAQAQRSLYDDSSYSSSHDTLSPHRYSGPHNKSGDQYATSSEVGGLGGGTMGGWSSTNPSQPPSHHPGAQRLPNPPPPHPSPPASQHHHQPELRRSEEHAYNTGIPGPPGPSEATPPFRAGGAGGNMQPWTTQVSAASHIPYQSRTTLNPQRDHMDYGHVNDLNNPPPPPPSSSSSSSAARAHDTFGLPSVRDYDPMYRSSAIPSSRPFQEGGVMRAGGVGGGMMDNPPPRAGGMPMDPLRPGVGGGGGGGTMDPPHRPVPSQLGDPDNQAARPSIACPMCGRDNFMTQTDLEMHAAQCQLPP